MPYIGKSPSFGVRNRFVYVADADDTSVSGADANGATLTFTDGAFVDVYLNGVLLKPTTDYNTTTANTIAGLSALNTSDEVTVVVYDVFAVADAVSASSGGTFSGGVNIDGAVIINESSADVDFRVESNGQTHMLFVDGGNDAVILGHSAKVDGINDDNEGVKGSGGQLQLHGATPVIDVFSYSTTDGTHGGINFMKSANNTVGSNTVISTGDVIGSIAFGGFDGADYASIMGKIDFQAGGSGMAENDTAGEMVFYTTQDGAGGGGSSERMRIESEGVVRITSQKFKVGTNASADSQIQFDSNASDYIIGIDQSDSGNFKIANSTALGTTDRLAFGAGGLITQSASVGGLMQDLNNAHGSAPYGIRINFTATDPDNNDNYFLAAEANGNNKIKIFSDGDIQNHDNAYGAFSDERIKQDIVDSNSQWDDIKAIKVRNFKKKDDVAQYGDKAWSQIGVVAQELETVSPKLIRECDPDPCEIKINSEFGTLYEDGDKIPEGKKVGDVKEVKSKVKAVNYSILYMKAVKALQEAMARIETLEAKVKALEEA